MSPPSRSDWLALADQAPVQAVFKADRRSRVWQIGVPQWPAGALVVKRFEYARARQVVAAVLGLHPGQRERRWVEELIRRGLPVPPLLAAGLRGGRYYLIRPYLGASVYNRLWEGQFARDPRRRHAIARALGTVTGQLLAAGLVNRDHKASNLLLDGEDKLWLIDTGALRRLGPRWRSLREAARAMLGQLDASLAQAARDAPAERAVSLTRTDRLRCLHALVAACPQVGSAREVMQKISHR